MPQQWGSFHPLERSRRCSRLHPDRSLEVGDTWRVNQQVEDVSRPPSTLSNTYSLPSIFSSPSLCHPVFQVNKSLKDYIRSWLGLEVKHLVGHLALRSCSSCWSTRLQGRPGGQSAWCKPRGSCHHTADFCGILGSSLPLATAMTIFRKWTRGWETFVIFSLPLEQIRYTCTTHTHTSMFPVICGR